MSYNINTMKYNIDIEASKASAISSEKSDRYEYVTGQVMLPSNQGQIIEQATFIYISLGNVFEKQTKTIEDQNTKGKNKLKLSRVLKLDSQQISIKGAILEDQLNEETKNEIEKINKMEKMVSRKDLNF